MKPRDLLLALLVVALWGANFSVIKIGLTGLDPYLMAALRFTLVALPAVFFVPRPRVPWRDLLLYGVLFGVLLWGLVYAGIAAGVSAGLGSLVLQSAAFFTVLLGALSLREMPQAHQIAGGVLAFAGIGLVFAVSDGSVSAAGVVLILCGALAWACANLVVKRSGPADMAAFMIWSCVAAPLPLLAIACARIGVEGVAQTLHGLDGRALASLAFQAYPSTLFGYAVWNGLLRRYPVASVAPVSLLVPVFGMATSVAVFGERLGGWKIAAMALVVAGLAVNLYGGTLLRRLRPIVP